MRPRTVSQRMLLITAVALLPALMIGISTAWTVTRDRVAALHSDAYRSAELAALELAQIVGSAENVLITTAAMPVVKRGDTALCSATLSEVVGDLRFLSSMMIVNDDGAVRCSSDPGGDDGFARSDLFDEVLTTGHRVIGASLPGEPHVLPVARRIGGGSDAPPGVAVAFIDIDWLQVQIAERSLGARDSLTVIDREGVIIARVPETEQFVGTKVPETAANLLNAPEPGTAEIESQDGERRVLGYFPASTNPSGLYVSAGMSITDGMAVARSVAATSALVGILGACIAVFVAIYMTQIFIANPVTRVIDTIAAWRSGNRAARSGMRVEDGEICGAGQTLDALLDELRDTDAARRKSEDERELLRNELDHRVKNMLSTVQAIVRQTFPKDGNEEAHRTFSQRLVAIGDANDLLKQSGWKSTALRGVVQAGVAPFSGRDEGRFSLHGPEVTIKGNVVLALSIALHELCTNAIKYGALSNATGKVAIRWQVVQTAEGDQFQLTWQETGGPPVAKPSRVGFGSKVIRVALASYIGGTVDIAFDASGLVCTVVAPAENVIVCPKAVVDLPQIPSRHTA